MLTNRRFFLGGQPAWRCGEVFFWWGWGADATRRSISERVARPRGGTGRIRPRQARPSRVAPRDFTSEQFRWVGTRRVGAVPSRAGPLSSFHLPDPRFRVLPPRVYDKKVTLSGKVAHAAVRAAALNEERLREA